MPTSHPEKIPILINLISHWTKEDFKKYNPEDHSIKNTLILVI